MDFSAEILQTRGEWNNIFRVLKMSIFSQEYFIWKIYLNIWEKKAFLAVGPITSWQIDGETMERVTDFIFLGSKITADGDCSHEIKRHLLLGRKAMTNLDSMLKSTDISLPTKVYIKAMVFPVVMYGCELDHKEGWVPKNWCFQTVVLKKTLGLQEDETSQS